MKGKTDEERGKSVQNAEILGNIQNPFIQIPATLYSIKELHIIIIIISPEAQNSLTQFSTGQRTVNQIHAEVIKNE